MIFLYFHSFILTIDIDFPSKIENEERNPDHLYLNDSEDEIEEDDDAGCFSLPGYRECLNQIRSAVKERRSMFVDYEKLKKE